MANIQVPNIEWATDTSLFHSHTRGESKQLWKTKGKFQWNLPGLKAVVEKHCIFIKSLKFPHFFLFCCRILLCHYSNGYQIVEWKLRLTDSIFQDLKSSIKKVKVIDEIFKKHPP